MCECEANRSMDMKTPKNVYLSAFYKRSFAFHTVKNRMPVILTSIIDNLARNKAAISQEYGEGVQEELKQVIGDISEFKYEVQTNKPLKKLTSQATDANWYNNYIDKVGAQDGPPTHFHTIWLLTECYMYRRVRQAFEETRLLTNHDPFRNQKEEAYTTALPLIIQLGTHLSNLLNNSSGADKEEFISLLKLNLWGNKCDLSISLGRVSKDTTLFDTKALDPQILSDHSERIWEAVADSYASSDIIDLVFDNSGYEVFTDLCLADYIISKDLAKRVRFYVKTIPWFISDVMTQDFHWTLKQLKRNKNVALRTLGDRWSDYVTSGVWSIVESDFWTLPYEYTCMAAVDPGLYKKLAEAKAVFFKGDLNYRKLFGEINWDPSTPIDEGLREFHPSKLCILRTIKADIVCGLTEGLAEEIGNKDPQWMEKGDWGLIQFSDQIVTIT